MINSDWVEMVLKNGLGVVLALGVFSLCVWMVKFIITKLDSQMERHTKALDKLVEKINRSDDRNSEAHRFQREEHQQMVSLLIKMNGNDPERSRP